MRRLRSPEHRSSNEDTMASGDRKDRGSLPGNDVAELVSRLEAENAALRSSKQRLAEEGGAREAELRDLVTRLTAQLAIVGGSGRDEDEGAASPGPSTSPSAEDQSNGFVYVKESDDASESAMAVLLSEARRRVAELEASVARLDDVVVERDTLAGEKRAFYLRLQATEDEYQRRLGELENE